MLYTKLYNAGMDSPKKKKRKLMQEHNKGISHKKKLKSSSNQREYTEKAKRQKKKKDRTHPLPLDAVRVGDAVEEDVEVGVAEGVAVDDAVAHSVMNVNPTTNLPPRNGLI
jgi:hypothetical protein